MIRLVDRDGDTVYMTKEEIAESLKKMGNPPGRYEFVQSTEDRTDEWAVKMFQPIKVPQYKFYQVWKKKLLWWLKERKKRKAFDKINDRGLIWKGTPFVLEKPWLRLKGKTSVTINVE